jgi:CMP-N,N'-diacetyllegionaminic acid synthase
MLKIWCVITARAGSKSVKNKNIKPFAGHPLLAHSIHQSITSKLINRTILSTDSVKYAKIGKKYGADVPFLRSKKNSGDKSPDIDLFKELIKKTKKNQLPSLLVHLRPTSPLRLKNELDKAIKLLINSNYDSLRSVTYSEKNLFKSWYIENDKLVPIYNGKVYKETGNLGRQFLPDTYIHNGSIDIFWTKTLLKKNSLNGKKIIPFIQKNYLDLDTKKDFNKLYALRYKDLKKFNLISS